MILTLTKRFTFEAAHKLPNHDGKCARLHGHSWVMEVEIKGYTVQVDGPKEGMMMDYADISKVVKPLVEEKLDHHYLNETTGIYPTSENLARWIFRELISQLPGLKAVTIFETCTTSCRYEP